MTTFRIVGNRTEGDLAASDDFGNASQIVAALMETRPRNSGDWWEYWIIDSAGNEYAYDADCGACFLDGACFHPNATRKPT